VQHFIANVLHHYGYWGLYGTLFGAMAAEYLFVPVPGETTLTTVGILWKQGHFGLHLIWLILATGLGTFTGSLIGYIIGRTLGRPFLERFGRYVRLTPARIDKAESLFTKYTVPTLIFSRFIAGVRIIVPYIAGINKTKLSTYLPVMLVSSLAWTATFIMAGSLIETEWAVFMHHWKRNLIPAILIVAVVVVGYWYFHHWMKRKMNDKG